MAFPALNSPDGPFPLQKGEEHLIGEWGNLCKVWYRRRTIWDMAWSRPSTGFSQPILTSFVGCSVAASPNGGPIAVLRTPATAGGMVLEIYTAGGTRMAEAPWSYEKLLTMAWTCSGTLVCVFVSGVVRVLSAFCEVLYCYAIDDRIKADGGVLSAVITVDAAVIAVLTVSMRLYVNLSLSRRCCVRLADPPLPSPPVCMRVLLGGEAEGPYPTGGALGHGDEPHCPPTRVAVLLASETGALFLVDHTAARRLPTPPGPYVALALSPSGRLLALLSQENVVTVYSAFSDFSTPLDTAELPRRLSGASDTKPPVSVLQLAWLADDCLGCHVVFPPGATQRHNGLFVGGPGNQWIFYGSADQDIFLVTELDGLRVIGTRSSYHIERVAPSTERVFSGVIGLGFRRSRVSSSGGLLEERAHQRPPSQSLAPAGALFSAWNKYVMQDSSANDALLAVLPNLEEAIVDCIDAATRELDGKAAIPLLRAATFGRLYLSESFAPKGTRTSADSASRSRHLTCQLYIAACRDLRVALALHALPLEMCVTVAQLRCMGPEPLLCLLAHRRMHLLALRIGAFLGLCNPKGIVQAVTPKIYSPSDIDASDALRSICASFSCAPMPRPPGTATAGGLCRRTVDDPTRPTGVALALCPPSEPTSHLLHTSSRVPTPTEAVSGEADSLGVEAVRYVLEHWAREKIRCSVDMTDQQLLKVLRETLATYAHIRPCIAKVALAAAQLSRLSLATLLLQFEPRSRVQVRILLRLAETDLALRQAVLAGDTDLIFECLAMVEAEETRHTSVAETPCTDYQRFLTVLQAFPLLWGYYEAICYRNQKLDWLQKLFEMAGAIEKAGWLCLKRALGLCPSSKIRAYRQYQRVCKGVSELPHDEHLDPADDDPTSGAHAGIASDAEDRPFVLPASRYLSSLRGAASAASQEPPRKNQKCTQDKIKHFLAHAAAFFGSASDPRSAATSSATTSNSANACSSGVHRGCRAAQQLVLEHLELLNLQQQFEALATQKNWARLPCRLVGLTLAQTLKELLVRNQAHEVQTIQKLFAVPQRRILKLHATVLLEHGLMDELEALAQQRANQTLVGGPAFFINLIRRKGNPPAAAQLLDTLEKTAAAGGPKENVWFPKMFQTFETNAAGAVALLPTLRGLERGGDRRTSSDAPTKKTFQETAESLMGSISGALINRRQLSREEYT